MFLPFARVQPPPGTAANDFHKQAPLLSGGAVMEAFESCPGKLGSLAPALSIRSSDVIPRGFAINRVRLLMALG